MLQWIKDNSEWLFSGVAIAVPLAIFGWFFFGRSKQVQKGGDHSTNIQVGGSVNLPSKDDTE